MRFEGFYFDGESAARHEVSVALAAESLQILKPEGGQIALWPYSELESLEEVYSTQPLRLFRKGEGGAILTMNQPNFLDALEQHSGRRFRTRPFFRPTWKLALIALVVMAVVGGAALTGLPLLTGPLAEWVPTAWERKLGARVIEQLAPEGETCKSPAGEAALEQLAARLLKGETVSPVIRVRVGRSSTVNAFAAPGGEIVLLKGFLDQADSPEEVAGVLAHEMAHSIKRHPLKGMLRALGLQLLFAALVGDTTVLESVASSYGQFLLTLSYTRAYEEEADRIGLRMLNRADIRGDGLISFFQRLTAGKTNVEPPRLLSSHPLHGERIDLIRKTAKGKGKAMSPAQWAALQAICK